MKQFACLFLMIALLSACQDGASDKSDKTEPAKVEAKTGAAVAEVKEGKEKQEGGDKKESDSHKSDSHDGHSNDGQSHEGHQHEGHQHEVKPATGEAFVKVDQNAECEAPVVIEFFAYHCPHCYSLEPAAEKWRAANKDNVEFISIPTTLGHDQLGSMLLVHHAAKHLGILEKTQHALFERFHKEKKLFASADEAAEFLAAQGAEKDKALAILNDQATMSKSIEADYELLMKYKISSVPQVLVNHQYMTNITAAGGHDEVFEVVDKTLAMPHNCVPK